METRKMKLSEGFKISFVLFVLTLVCPVMSLASWSVEFYDNFSDYNIDDWDVRHLSGAPSNPPDIVSSPEGYSLRGVGSGYAPDPGLNVHIAQSLSISDVGELKVEMRAKSGPQWPNSVTVSLASGNDRYHFRDYGEIGENETADMLCLINGVEHTNRKYIGAQAFEWHTFAWTRDADGWWTLSIDDNPVWEDFHQDNELTSFDQIGIGLLRNQSEIEWVRVSAVPEPATISLLGLGSLLFTRKRR